MVKISSKPYEQMDDLGGFTLKKPLFLGSTPKWRVAINKGKDSSHNGPDEPRNAPETGGEQLTEDPGSGLKVWWEVSGRFIETYFKYTFSNDHLKTLEEWLL